LSGKDQYPTLKRRLTRSQVLPATTFILSFVPIPSKASVVLLGSQTRRTSLYVLPPQTTSQGMRSRIAKHATLGPWTTRPLWFSYSVVVARQSSYVHPLDSLLMTVLHSQERMDVRATSQAEPKNRFRPHVLPNATYHPPILALFYRMARISSRYRLPGLEATPGPHFALGRPSLTAHGRFAPQ